MLQSGKLTVIVPHGGERGGGAEIAGESAVAIRRTSGTAPRCVAPIWNVPEPIEPVRDSRCIVGVPGNGDEVVSAGSTSPTSIWMPSPLWAGSSEVAALITADRQRQRVGGVRRLGLYAGMSKRHRRIAGQVVNVNRQRLVEVEDLFVDSSSRKPRHCCRTADRRHTPGCTRYSDRWRSAAQMVGLKPTPGKTG